MKSKLAYDLNNLNSRNTIYDYCSYILARDNDYTLLTGDWKLKKYVGDKVNIVGVISYVLDLENKKVISKGKLLNVLKLWLDDDEVYLPSNILEKLIIEIEEGKDNGN